MWDIQKGTCQKQWPPLTYPLKPPRNEHRVEVAPAPETRHDARLIRKHQNRSSMRRPFSAHARKKRMVLPPPPPPPPSSSSRRLRKNRLAAHAVVAAAAAAGQGYLVSNRQMSKHGAVEDGARDGIGIDDRGLNGLGQVNPSQSGRRREGKIDEIN